MSGTGGPSDRRRMRPASGSSGTGSLLATLGVAAAGIAGLAIADHARAQAEGRESAVQSVMRWFTEDVLGGTDAPAGPSRRRRGGLSPEEAEALPTRVFREVDAARITGEREGECKGMCAICQDVFVVEDVLLRLQCFHEFHKDCVVSYLTGASSPGCPVCRHPVTIEE